MKAREKRVAELERQNLTPLDAEIIELMEALYYGAPDGPELVHKIVAECADARAARRIDDCFAAEQQCQATNYD